MNSNKNHHPDYNPNIQIKSEPGIASNDASAPTLEISSLNNVQIKAEPGTENNISSTSSSINSNSLNNIKIEPSLFRSSTRLPSLRGPRDLTLGGNVKLEKQKKVFTPNLNVTRNKNRENPYTNNDNSSKLKKEKFNDKDKRQDKSRERGRGRGRGTNNLVQSSGIFSEGLSDSLTAKRPGYAGATSGRSSDGFGCQRGSSSSFAIQKSTISEVDNNAEEEGSNDEFDDFKMDYKDSFVSLPIANNAKQLNEVIGNNSVKHNSDTELKADKLKTKLQEMKVTDKSLKLTVSQVIQDQTENSYKLLQFPPCLPGLPTDEIDKTDKTDKTNKKNKNCTVSSLKEGVLGKIQVLRSGKARLVLGENNLIIDIGTSTSFRQDLIAAKIKDDKSSGTLVNLGTVDSKLILTVDWETILKNCK
ncbi:hypothetical protein TKK_0010079 [Trichogramma kaykai]|uniref:DNA-directed RNA polymerase III subunit RPC4 n=1 Tax=Trichogramma kaykai TaxID=54128 RepID=A0ABD2WYB2_9HYME